MFTRTVPQILETLMAALIVLGTLGTANAYTPTEKMKPTDLNITLRLSSVPIHNNFTRYLVFENRAGREKSVPVSFSRSSHLVYSGVIDASGLNTLQSLVDHGNRSYWDSMTLENRGGSTSLAIRTMEIEIEYANTCCGRDTNSMIGYVANRTLASGTSSIYISGLLGRREHIKDQFGWSNTEFYALPPSLRYFFYDIGKSGSSGAADSVSASNPKYASGTSKALCSETVSWYYHEHGVSFRDHLFPWLTYDFEDITSHSVIHDHFKKGDRLYCYHFGRDQWIKRDRFYNWVYRDTYQPQAGDYLDRRPSDPTDGDDGHAMVVITWDDESNIVETIDGPYNINIRPVDIRAEEDDGTDYCVGRIPFND